jgi:hypothetical protein
MQSAPRFHDCPYPFKMKTRFLKTALVLLPLAASGEPSSIDTAARHAYSANAGWLDLRPSASAGVHVTDTFLGGHAYAANFGWINLGSGAPANGHTYTNASATDFGVNLSPDGSLAGYAYASNIGWISFEQTHGQPRVNLLDGKFSGSAYSANIGWIRLDTAFPQLATATITRRDSDHDGIPDNWERLHWGNLTTADALTDSDADGQPDAAEYLAGTSPLDRASLLRIVSQTFSGDHTQSEITFTISPHRKYRVEHNETLLGAWMDSPHGTFTTVPGPTATRSLTLPAAERRFFRVAAVQPLPDTP